MKVPMQPCLIAMLVFGLFVLLPARAALADAGHGTSGHPTFPGKVVRKAGAPPRVQTSDGSTYQLSDKIAREFGVEPFKDGEEVLVTVDENNAIIDIHRKGEKSNHRFVTGKLIHVGRMKPEIKIQTDEGEKVFPLLNQETKTKPLPEGTMVTVEINEAGAVIDLHLHKAENAGKKE